MLKSGTKLKILVLTLSLLSCCPYLMNTGESAEIEYIQRGWTAPTTGYYVTERAARDILAGWRSDRAEKEIYKRSFNELHLESRITTEILEEQIADIKESLKNERFANEAALRKANAPGFGLFAGVGYAPFNSGEVRFVVGFGWTWRVF